MKKLDSSLFVLSPRLRVVGSKYKYSRLVSKFSPVRFLFATRMEQLKSEMKMFHPRYVFVMGDVWHEWKFCFELGIEYVLIAQDIMGLRNPRELVRHAEEGMFVNAKKIITPSPLFADYIKKEWGRDSIVIPLQPLRKDIDFRPLKKLPGKTLAYAGGIVGWKGRGEMYGYRYYADIFKRFIEQGWQVHVYPAYACGPSRLRDYRVAGCVLHPTIAQKQLYKELSQYTAGFHGYNSEGVPAQAFRYTQLCVPNKVWEYLAAGIPTVSYQGGYSGKLIAESGHGVFLESLNDIHKIALPTVSAETRQNSVIDNWAEALHEYLE